MTETPPPDELRKFASKSYISLLAPVYTSSEGSSLQFRSPYSGKTRTILDANQNAGCCIFGHHPPASVDALEALLAARRPLRLPFARSSDEEALRSELLARAALGEGSRCVLGLSSGAQAIDLALSLALTAPRPGGPLFDPCDSEPPPPMSVVLLRGSFHGNCTRAAFSSSAVFRAHAQRETLCEFTAIYLEPDADAAAVDAAFAAHDAGSTAIVAVLVEPQQHFAAFARLASPTAAALGTAAARRGVPVICDEIWSGVHRTGSFLACTSGGLRPARHPRRGSPRRRARVPPRICPPGPSCARAFRPPHLTRGRGEIIMIICRPITFGGESSTPSSSSSPAIFIMTCLPTSACVTSRPRKSIENLTLSPLERNLDACFLRTP